MTAELIAERNNLSVAQVRELAKLTPVMLERIAQHRAAFAEIFEPTNTPDEDEALLIVANDLAAARAVMPYDYYTTEGQDWIRGFNAPSREQLQFGDRLYTADESGYLEYVGDGLTIPYARQTPQDIYRQVGGPLRLTSSQTVRWRILKARSNTERASLMAGPEFKACRLACELTQSEWALALGYRLKTPRQQISDMEGGRRPISPVTADLALAYSRHGVPSELHGGDRRPLERLAEMYRRFGVTERADAE